jgi:hypothetical protein
MVDPLKDVFSSAVIGALAAIEPKSPALVERLKVLLAGSPVHRARKAAWEAYLDAAFALGMFDPPHGGDLRSRLTALDDDLFRGAMAECMTGWVLAGKLRVPVEPRPAGRGARLLEFLVKHADGDIRVEVKAPLQPRTRTWRGDGSEFLAAALKKANEQFSHGVRNLFVIAPDLPCPVFRDRAQLTRAFYVEKAFRIPLDATTGSPVRPVVEELVPRGFLNRHTPTGNLDHQLLMAHNPFAARPIPSEIWGSIPQFLEVADEMAWNDGGRAL